MTSSFPQNYVPCVETSRMVLTNNERKLLDLYGGVAYDHETLPKIVAVHSLYLDPINPPHTSDLRHILPSDKQRLLRETASTPQETKIQKKCVISIKSGTPFFKSCNFELPEGTENQCHFTHGKPYCSQSTCTVPYMNRDVNFVKYKVQPQDTSATNFLEHFSPFNSHHTLNTSEEIITEDFERNQMEKPNGFVPDHDLAAGSSSDHASSGEDSLDDETTAKTDFVERESSLIHSKKDRTEQPSKNTDTDSRADETHCSVSKESIDAPRVSIEATRQPDCEGEIQDESSIIQTEVEKTASFDNNLKIQERNKGKNTLFQKLSSLTKSGYSVSSALNLLAKSGELEKERKNAKRDPTRSDHTILTENFLRSFALMEKLKRQNAAKLRITPKQKETYAKKQCSQITCEGTGSNDKKVLNGKTKKHTVTARTNQDETIGLNPQRTKETMNPIVKCVKDKTQLNLDSVIVEARDDMQVYTSIQQDLVRQHETTKQEKKYDSKLKEFQKHESDRLIEELETPCSPNRNSDFEQNANTVSHLTPLSSNIATGQHNSTVQTNEPSWKNTTFPFESSNIPYAHMDRPPTSNSTSCLHMTNPLNLSTKQSEELSFPMATTSDCFESYPINEYTASPKLTICHFPSKADNIERLRCENSSIGHSKPMQRRHYAQSQNTVCGERRESKASQQSLENSPSEPSGLKRNFNIIEETHSAFQTKRSRKSAPRKLRLDRKEPAEPRYDDCQQDASLKTRYTPIHDHKLADVSFSYSSAEAKASSGTTLNMAARQDTSYHQWRTSSTPPLPETGLQEHYTIETSLDRAERIKTLLAKQTHLLSKIMRRTEEETA